MRSQPTCRKRLLVRTPVQFIVGQPFQMLARCPRFVLKLRSQRINRLHRALLLLAVLPMPARHGKSTAFIFSHSQKVGGVLIVGASLRGRPLFHQMRGAHGGTPLQIRTLLAKRGGSYCVPSPVSRTVSARIDTSPENYLT